MSLKITNKLNLSLFTCYFYSKVAASQSIDFKLDYKAAFALHEKTRRFRRHFFRYLKFSA